MRQNKVCIHTFVDTDRVVILRLISIYDTSRVMSHTLMILSRAFLAMIPIGSMFEVLELIVKNDLSLLKPRSLDELTWLAH